MATAFDKFDLKGRTALVTGGGSGLGFHMARALARSGAHVTISGRREDLLKQASTELMSDPLVSRVDWHPVDLVDRQSVDSLAKHMLASQGGVDIFIGNAGATYVEQIPDLNEESIDDGFQLNLISNMQFAKAFLPGMRERKWGRFIFSSSIASTHVSALEGTGTYAASKAGLNGFCRQIAADSGHDNITANALVLGFFMTDILQSGVKYIRENQGEAAAKQFLDDFVSVTALGRIGDPAEVEGLVQLLGSDAGSYITGASIAIDGGMSIMMRPLPMNA